MAQVLFSDMITLPNMLLSYLLAPLIYGSGIVFIYFLTQLVECLKDNGNNQRPIGVYCEIIYSASVV